MYSVWFQLFIKTYFNIRQTMYNVNNLYDLFINVAGDTNLNFIKEINLHTKI